MTILHRVSKALATMVVSTALCAPSLAQMPDWPKQVQIDLSPFIAVGERYYGSPLGKQHEPEAALQACKMSKDRLALAAGLTPQGTRQINPAANTASASAELITRVRSIAIYSTPAGCAKLDSAEYLAAVPDEQRAAFSARDLSQPVFIQARFHTGSTDKKALSATHNVVIRHFPTGIEHYPWAVRIWNQYSWKGIKAVHGIAHWPPLISVTLNFQSLPGMEYHRVQLLGTYSDTGQALSPSLTLSWHRDGHEYSRIWNGELVNSYRDNKKHGINFSVVNVIDWLFQFDCHVDGVAQDYYRIINTYDCEAAQQSQFGQQGVLRSSQLVRLVAEAEAAAELTAAKFTPANGTTGNADSGAGAECIKAYAAARLCQQIPADPFGIARGVCSSGVKNKFGGSGCKLPF